MGPLDIVTVTQRKDGAIVRVAMLCPLCNVKLDLTAAQTIGMDMIDCSCGFARRLDVTKHV